MQPILTLTIQEFHLVDDFFLWATLFMSIAGFLFFKSARAFSFQTRERLALDLTGIAVIVTALCSYWLNRSWNTAFELAGNSYAASGHLFRSDYRYVAWLITAPALLSAFAFVLPLERPARSFFLRRSIFSVLLLLFFGVTKTWRAEIASTLLTIVADLLAVAALYNLFLLFWKQIPQSLIQSPSEVHQLFFKARRFLFLSWLIYPLLAFFASRSFFATSKGMVFLIIATTLTDVISQSGMGLYIYKLVKVQQPRCRE